MVEDSESPLGGPLELPGEPPASHVQSKPPRQRRGIKKLLIVLGIIVVVAALGYGTWKLLKKDDSESDSSTSTQSATSKPTNSNKDVPANVTLKEFTSTDLGVELSHPDTWTASETAGGIRLTSPDFSYQATDGTTINGNFRVYIRKGARTTDSKYIGRGVAIESSQKLTYANPTSGQRKDTLITSFGLDEPDNFGYFFVAGNFQLNKGDTLGPDYGKEAETFIVAGGYSSDELTDDLATNKVPASSYNQTNAYKQAIDIIKSLKLQ